MRLCIAFVLLLSAWAFAEGRLESEFKLAVPEGQREAVWQYLNEAYGPQGTILTELGTRYTVTFAREEFLDRYFDMPELSLLQRKFGLRHRSRYVREGSNLRKDGRQLVQLKISSEDKTGVVRQELKFETRRNARSVRNGEDHLPCLGLVRRSERPALREQLRSLDVEPKRLVEVVSLLQARDRVYVSRDGIAFATITLDHVVARHGPYTAVFVEMELELNEIAYTDAGPEARQEMTVVNTRMKDDLMRRFPGLVQDQTPKYNKAVDRLRLTVPMFDVFLPLGFRPEVALGLTIVLCLPIVLLFRWSARRSKRRLV